MPRSERFLHHHVVALLQVSDEVIRHEFRHQIISVAEPAATIALKGKAQRKPKLIGVGRAQLCWVIDHADKLDQPGNKSRTSSQRCLAPSPPDPHSDGMPDRPFPAVEALVRRVQRVAANRPDPLHILAQTIAMTGTIGVDPYAVLGVLVEGAVQTLVQHIPAERQAEAVAALRQLLDERLAASGLSDRN